MSGPATELPLSGRVGAPVVSHGGRRVGRVADLTVLLGSSRPQIARLLVRAGRRMVCLIDWEDVATLARRRVVLRDDADLHWVRADEVSLAPQELLLVRDVLDTQVFDLDGQRLSRVSEVMLGGTAERPEVIGVDLGTAALLRRIGLGLFTRRVPPTPVPWTALHLTSQRGHVVQLSAEAASFRRLDGRSLASLLARLDTRKGVDILEAVDAGHAASAVHRSHPQTGRRLVHALSTEGRRRLTTAASAAAAAAIDELARPVSALRRRRFLRSAGWRLHRPPRG